MKKQNVLEINETPRIRAPKKGEKVTDYKKLPFFKKDEKKAPAKKVEKPKTKGKRGK